MTVASQGLRLSEPPWKNPPSIISTAKLLDRIPNATGIIKDNLPVMISLTNTPAKSTLLIVCLQVGYIRWHSLSPMAWTWICLGAIIHHNIPITFTLVDLLVLPFLQINFSFSLEQTIKMQSLHTKK